VLGVKCWFYVNSFKCLFLIDNEYTSFHLRIIKYTLILISFANTTWSLALNQRTTNFSFYDPFNFQSSYHNYRRHKINLCKISLIFVFICCLIFNSLQYDLTLESLVQCELNNTHE
jgi:hypothetical protein